MGLTRARELSHRARTFTGSAATWGLATKVVPLVEFDAAVAELVDTIAANSSGSIAAYKDLYRVALEGGLTSGLEYVGQRIGPRAPRGSGSVWSCSWKRTQSAVVALASATLLGDRVTVVPPAPLPQWCAAFKEGPVAIRAVMFDFGGVISTSPFEAFSRFETENGLPPGFIRRVNATDPDDNAWARLERSEIGIDEFGQEWAAEARALGREVDGRMVLEMLAGQIRPRMVAAIETCRSSYKTACLTNNFARAEHVVSDEMAAVYALFDAVLESRVLGVRKPDPRFYELACEAVEVRPDEAVFLDDLGVNLKPARALGMHTIKVADPDEALAELAELLGVTFSE